MTPGRGDVLPLTPDSIVSQDGYDKQDCETAAAKRCSRPRVVTTAHGLTVLGGDLYRDQALYSAACAEGLDFLFMCKAASHATLTEWVDVGFTTGSRKLRRSTVPTVFLSGITLH